MIVDHHEDKHPNIRLGVYSQADMQMLRFQSQDYIAAFSIIIKGKRASLWENKAKECKSAFNEIITRIVHKRAYNEPLHYLPCMTIDVIPFAFLRKWAENPCGV